MNISKVANKVRPSSTLSLSALADKKRKEGIDIINFSAGEPDFNTPENICQAAITAINNNFTKYTAYEGIYELRQAVANRLRADFGLDYDACNVIISNGSKQALLNSFTAILDQGDEVIVPAPYWNSYIDMIYIAGGVPIEVKTKKENSFKITLEELEGAYTPKTKAIIINSPNNPTGMVYSEEELKNIADFANEKDIFVISDEIYNKMVYSRKLKHISIASLGEDIFKRTIVIGGFSKSYSMTGWRVGFAAAKKEIIDAMANIQSNTTSNVNSVAQMAALEALTGDQSAMEEMLKEFQRRRDFIAQRISDTPLLSSLLPKGAFYLFVDVSKLLGYEIQGIKINNSSDVAKALLELYNVVVVPSDAFGYENYIRISYATSMRDVVEGCNRIEKFIKENF
ncbi:MAG: pyridoxal phosphate-dependent aminotransferase [Lachnospirales bacterium]